MLHFAANISLLFQEFPFLERFQAARNSGFRGVECLALYDYQPTDISHYLKQADLQLVLMNSPSGHVQSGEIGIAALPHRKDEFIDSVDVTIEYARALNCKRVHIPSGLVPRGEDYRLYFDTYVDNLRYAAPRLAELDVTVLVEPINKRRLPTYLIEKIEQAKLVIERVGEKNIGLQFDFYHVQITEGDLVTRFKENFDIIKHIQIAGVPERFEPSIGEINYPYIFDMIEKSGYAGWIGCEYSPQKTTTEGLEWFSKYAL